jgi:hypothetical protein
MKKNIIKFIIIFLLIFGISDSKVFAQFSKKISGEQLEKLLTENYILINGRFGSFKWEFNKDKTYYVFPHHDKTFQMPNNGTWEITGFLGGGSSLILTDRQQIINGRNIKYQFYFGEDGYIYTGSERMHTYSLENIQEKISREARLVEEKRIAEELRLKKIEEEKRQLAIKREQERIKQEQERIKQEEEKKRFQAEYELAVKKDKERREEEERKELYASIVKYSLLGLFLLIISYLTYKYKSKIFEYKSKIFLDLKKSFNKEFLNKKLNKSTTFSELINKPLQSLNLKDFDVNKSTIFEMTGYKTFVIRFKKKIEWGKILEFLNKNLDDKNINAKNLSYSLHNLRSDGSWDNREVLVGNAMEFRCFDQSLRYQFANHYKYAERISNLVNKKFLNLEGLTYNEILDVKNIISANLTSEGKIKLRYKWGWSIAIFFLFLIFAGMFSEENRYTTSDEQAYCDRYADPYNVLLRSKDHLDYSNYRFRREACIREIIKYKKLKH